MNDIDLWNEIEEAEREGDKERAKELLQIHVNLFQEYNPKIAEKLIEKYEKKWKTNLHLV